MTSDGGMGVLRCGAPNGGMGVLRCGAPMSNGGMGVLRCGAPMSSGGMGVLRCGAPMSNDAHDGGVLPSLVRFAREDDLAALDDVEPVRVFRHVIDVRLRHQHRMPEPRDRRDRVA